MAAPTSVLALLRCSSARRALRGEGDVVAWCARVGGPQGARLIPRRCLRKPEAADVTLKSNLATTAAGKGMQWRCTSVGRDAGGNRQRHPRRRPASTPEMPAMASGPRGRLNSRRHIPTSATPPRAYTAASLAHPYLRRPSPRGGGSAAWCASR
jgi:hypothetical protein